MINFLQQAMLSCQPPQILAHLTQASSSNWLWALINLSSPPQKIVDVETSSSSMPGAACRALLLYSMLWRSLLLLSTQLDCLVEVSNTFKMILPRSKVWAC